MMRHRHKNMQIICKAGLDNPHLPCQFSSCQSQAYCNPPDHHLHRKQQSILHISYTFMAITNHLFLLSVPESESWMSLSRGSLFCSSSSSSSSSLSSNRQPSASHSSWRRASVASAPAELARFCACNHTLRTRLCSKEHETHNQRKHRDYSCTKMLTISLNGVLGVLYTRAMYESGT